jgi:type III pantothenate kinase
MIICIDAGNSSVKICEFDRSGSRGRVHRVDLAGNSRSWDSILKSVVIKPQRIQGAVISSVVPSLTPPIAQAVQRRTGQKPLVVDEGLRFPFRISVPNPETTGADRLCCAAGAIDKRRTSAILIDVGSAVTVDLIHNAVYKGGIILAGPDLSLHALAQHTEKLPLLTFHNPATKPSSRFNTTEHSLRLGARMSTLGGIRESVRFLERRAGRHLVKILTGGAASVVAYSLPKSWRRDSHLVLRGLYRLWNLNTPV